MIDGVEAVASWQDQTAPAVSSQPLHLGAGLHRLVLEYYGEELERLQDGTNVITSYGYDDSGRL